MSIPIMLLMVLWLGSRVIAPTTTVASRLEVASAPPLGQQYFSLLDDITFALNGRPDLSSTR